MIEKEERTTKEGIERRKAKEATRERDEGRNTKGLRGGRRALSLLQVHMLPLAAPLFSLMPHKHTHEHHHQPHISYLTKLYLYILKYHLHSTQPVQHPSPLTPVTFNHEIYGVLVSKVSLKTSKVRGKVWVSM